MERVRWIFLLAGTGLALAADATAAGAGATSFGRLAARDRATMQQEVQVLIGLLETYHYRSRPLLELDASEVIESYLSVLDGRRAWLTRADEQWVQRRFARSLKSSYLLSGDLYPAFEIFDLFRERFTARQAWIQQRLGEPFDFTGGGVFVWDRSGRERPAGAPEADRLWEQILAAELIEELVLDPDETRARGRVATRFRQEAERLSSLGSEDIEEMFLNALLLLQDPHSGYDSWDTLLDRDVEMTGSLVGIGADLKVVDGSVVVDRLVPGGAAELSGGLRPGDRIEALGEEGGGIVSVAGMALQDVVQRIRGEANSRLVLSVGRPGEAEPRTVALARQRLPVSETRAHAVLYEVPTDAGTVRIGVVVLPAFYGDPGATGDEASSAGADVRELLGKLSAEGAAAVVLDLRENPGGHIIEAVRVAGLFITRGPVVITRDASGRTEVMNDEEGAVAWSGPLLVLTSRQSASASEVVAGALRAYGRAVVVGEAGTFGKGTSQMVIPLREVGVAPAGQDRSRWGALRLTGQRFYLPDGSATQIRGVASAIVLPSFHSGNDPTESDLPGALPWNSVSVPSFAAQRVEAMRGVWQVSAPLLEHLEGRTRQRLEVLPEFAWWRARISLWEDWFGAGTMELDLERERQRHRALDQRRRASGLERRQLIARHGHAARTLRLEVVTRQQTAHQAALAREPGSDPRERAGKVIDDVFHHPGPGDEGLREVRLRDVDFPRYRDDAPELADAFGRAAPGLALSAAQLALALVDGAEAPGGEQSPFVQRLAERARTSVSDPEFQSGLNALCAQLLELDPTLLGEPRPFDVHLREALRVAADSAAWSEIGSVAP